MKGEDLEGWEHKTEEEKAKEVEGEFGEELDGIDEGEAVGAGVFKTGERIDAEVVNVCLLYTSPSPRDRQRSRMPSSA